MAKTFGRLPESCFMLQLQQDSILMNNYSSIDFNNIFKIAIDGFLFDPYEIQKLGYCAKNSAGDTILHIAVLVGEISKVKYLVCNGLDINAKGDNGNTPLHNAAMQNNIEIYAYLVKEGADTTIRNIFDLLPIDYFE